ncbi:MAG: lipopolysaccharide biosynthesis protein [Thermoguttaceae bacterium]|nr:lipopolysaccharide biosynthesis protein [Thermoguttaceae bacterium]
MEDSGIPADDKNITRRSFKAAGWVLIVQFTMQFVQIFLGICMARLLTPEDYGTIGMLSIFWAVCEVFIIGGFSQALIQRKEITETDLSSVFCYNIFLSLLLFALMNLSARRIALFYGEDVLEPMIRVMAWILPIGALSAVQRVLLSRQLKQFFVTVSTLVSNLIAGLIAIFLAWRDLGVWALVWQRVIASILFTVSVFLFVRWIPKLKFSFKALASLFSYGSKLLAIALLDAFVMNFTNLVVGKRETKATLGFYTRSKSYARLWPFSAQGAIVGVLFPAFSKIQDDIPRLRGAFRRSLALSSFAVVFLPLLLCVLCRPIILLLLGEKWLPCVPYWWLVTFTVLFFPIQSLNVQLLKAMGKPGLYLFLEIIKKTLYAVQIIILIRWGIMPMLWCEIAFSLICVWMNSYFTGRDLQYGIFAQLRDFAPYPLITFPSCLFAWELYWIIARVSSWAGLITAAFAGIFVYLALNRVFKTPALREFVTLAGSKLPIIKKIFFCEDAAKPIR